MANEKRLIDANALLEKGYWHGKHPDWENPFAEGVDAVDTIDIENAPTVDAVEVVHGRWIDNIDENGYLCNAWRKCSACGGLNYSKRPPYCPNCGAKMDGGNEK